VTGAAAPRTPCPGPDGQAGTRLYCIPHAGGNAAFFSALREHLPPTVCCLPLELPGRGRRHREPLHTDMQAMARDLLARMEPLAAPYALFGHSLGALLALLCALLAKDGGLPPPRALFLSAAAAPVDWSDSRPPAIAALPSKELWGRVAQMGGMPDCIAASEELLGHFEPILRADLTALESWRPGPMEPLPAPITVFLGDRDMVTERQALQWRQLTLGEFRLRVLPGGHFYLQEHWRVLADHITQTLHP
jgi:surfactin synthase thioesterase subunit